jgi:hypothetical protein
MELLHKWILFWRFCFNGCAFSIKFLFDVLGWMVAHFTKSKIGNSTNKHKQQNGNQKWQTQLIFHKLKYKTITAQCMF